MQKEFYFFGLPRRVLPLLLLNFGAILQKSSSLKCLICAESNLEEFGECASPFEYNCDNYQKRFPENVKVYCRTTRHKAKNDTYTVVKECIAESLHYSTFPRKAYTLDEECDVLEVDGFEVAYCVCRNTDLCNKLPIVNQFTAFEDKHPEFFDPLPEQSAEQSTELAESFDRRTPMPSTQTTNSVHPDGRGRERLITSETTRPTETESEEDSAFVTAPGANNGGLTGSSNFLAPEFLAPMSNQKSPSTTSIPGSRNGQMYLSMPKISKSGGVSSVGSSLGLLPELSCMHCSHPGLPDATSDCSNQVVIGCPDQTRQNPRVGRPFCFTRQVITPRGQYGVEKMCVTERAVFEEYSNVASELLKNAESEGGVCGSREMNGTQIRYCICGSSSQCNLASIAEQMVFGKTLESAPIDASPLLVGAKNKLENGNDQLLEEFKKTTQQARLLPTEATLTTTAPAGTKLATSGEALNCAVCLDVDLSNALADCRSASSVNCAHKIHNEKAFCLTRQTQNGKGSYIVEKSCVSKKEFFTLFPEEQRKEGSSSSGDGVPLGCAATYDGYVNYCLCDGQMCNRNSLNEQASAYGRAKQPKVALTSSAVSNSHGGSATVSFTGDNNENGPVDEQDAFIEEPTFTRTSPSGHGHSPTTTDHSPITTLTTATTTTTRGQHQQNFLSSNVRIEDTANAKKSHPAPSGAREDMRPSTSSGTTPTTVNTSNKVRDRLEKWKASAVVPPHDASSANAKGVANGSVLFGLPFLFASLVLFS